MLRLGYLALGAVGDGEYFQLGLIILGAVSILYMAIYVMLRRRREKARLAEESADLMSAMIPPPRDEIISVK